MFDLIVIVCKSVVQLEIAHSSITHVGAKDLYIQVNDIFIQKDWLSWQKKLSQNTNQMPFLSWS